MKRILFALVLVLIVSSRLEAQPATPCIPNAASWTVTTNAATPWICASDGQSWLRPAAATANTLATPRTINGVSFNGSADVTVTAAAGTLSGTTLASGVTASSLTSFAAGATLTTTTGNLGFATGAGGAQTQATNKATTVVSNTSTTAITMNAASLAAATIVAFTFTNSKIAATDQVVCTHQSAGTSAAYTINAFPGAGSAVVSVRNNTAGALAEAIVVRCSVIKAVSS